MAGDKIRFRFRKTGLLRLLSHLDLMRCVERMLRRANLPFRSTLGFHPTPRAVFALSLPLGIDGLNEVFELELKEPFEAEEVRERLNGQAPVGLEFTSAVEVPLKASAVPRSVTYTMPLPAERVDAAREAAAKLMASEKVWADRYKPRPRRVNIRPYLRDIGVVENLPPPSPPLPLREGGEVETPPPSSQERGGRGGVGLLALDLWVTGSGTARADELLNLLGLADLPEAGFALARTSLAVHDETPPGQPDAPPVGPPDTAPLEIAPVDTGDDAPTRPEWGLSPNGPVVE